MRKSIFKRTFFPCFLIFAATVIASSSLLAQDKIILKNGESVEGEVQSVEANGNVTFKMANGVIPYPKGNINKVELGDRPEFAEGVAAVEQQDYKTAIDKLKPLVDKFLGIDAEWVAEAAGDLAESLAQTGKTYDSEQLCDKVIAAYPNSPYKYKGMIGKAYTLVVREKYDDAIALLKEADEALKPGPVPNPKIMDIMGDLNYVRGQAYEKKSDNAKALESYLRVVTLYYQPVKRAQQAQTKASDIRKKNPGIAVE
jgi:tetratricopeptide (TPR) repeat protein